MLKKTAKHIVIVALGVIALAGAARVHAQEMTVELDPAQTRIEFTLGASLHTVHGSFQRKSGVIHFDPASGTASGVVVVDATSAETGNKSRDRKMHSQVLESQKYPEITFSPGKLSGPLARPGQSSVQLQGSFRLHGDDHTISLTVPVQITGDTVMAKAQFVIPYVAWGLKNPSTFLLHVSDKVQVDVTAVGHITK